MTGSSSPDWDPTSAWHSSAAKGGVNYVGFKNPAADKLLEQARTEIERPARDALLRQLGVILQDHQPYTIVFAKGAIDLMHKRVKGARPSLAWWNYETMWIDPAFARK